MMTCCVSHLPCQYRIDFARVAFDAPIAFLLLTYSVCQPESQRVREGSFRASIGTPMVPFAAQSGDFGTESRAGDAGNAVTL